MTKEEIIKLPHLAIAEIKKFVHVRTEEGYFITESICEDIRDYYGCECMYMPILDNYRDYKIITKEEHEANEKAREAAYEYN